MPLPIAAVAGLAGALLGGGTQISQNTNVTNANNNTFNPTINFGGGATFTDTAPTVNDFIASASSAQTQEQADPADLLSLLGPTGAAGDILGGIGPLISGVSSTASSAGISASPAPDTSDALPTPLLITGLVAAGIIGVVLFKPKKKGR